jgi:hypothetical protein
VPSHLQTPAFDVIKNDIRIKKWVKYGLGYLAYSTKLYFASFLVGYGNGFTPRAME